MTNAKKSQSLKETFPVVGMSCAACASSVESILLKTEGVQSASVNFASQSVLVEYTKGTEASQLQTALQKVGYDLIIDEEDPFEAQKESQLKEYQKLKKRTIAAALLTTPIFILGMLFSDWETGRWISLFLSLPVLFVFGRHFYVNAWKQARNGTTNMDTLVAISTSIAFIFSVFNTVFPSFWYAQNMQVHVYYEAATAIITFVSLGKLLEEKAKSNTSSAIKKLMSLQPKTLKALVDGMEQEIPISSVKKGYTILVHPGECIAVDGIVLSGNSFVDESTITGEALAVSKFEGEKVFAGTINQKGSFQFIAEKVGNETVLAQIIKVVHQAQNSKAPVQKLVDKIASVFVPVVLVLSVLTFLIWLFSGVENALTHALLTSVAVLVIACPCALGLATPTAIMVGIGKGAENNILIKDAESLELGHKVNAVVFDKTGTITEGKTTVTDLNWLQTEKTEFYSSILLSLESKSEHPLASAMVNKLLETGVSPHSLTHFESLTGKGIKGFTSDEKLFLAGNERLLNEYSLQIPTSAQFKIDQWKSEAKTVVYFFNEEEVLAILALSDQIKASSQKAIERLRKEGMEVYMLTGDNHQTAEALAKNLSLTDFKAEMLPQDKANFIKDLQDRGKIVAMVGDGINDSQALALADVSIAMGKGSDIAMEVSSITLLTSDLESVPKALKLSGITVKGIRQNLFWAFVYNIIGIPIAAGILYPFNGFLLSPMIAGAAMALSSVSVVSNSLRLKTIQL